MTTQEKQSQTDIEPLFDHLPADKFSQPQRVAKVEANIDLSNAMRQALNAPQYFPPLNESVFPGDSVAIAIQSGIPHVRDVIGALIEQLSSAKIEVSDIVVVITPRTAKQLGFSPKTYEIADENKGEGKRPTIFPVEFEFNTVNFQVHDPENQTGHSYLVANADSEPVHVNRILVDADFVIPVGSPAPGDTGHQVDCVYPEFSNDVIRNRFAQGKGSFVARWMEIELANDTLGAFFSVQIVCGPGDTIRQVSSGARKDVVSAARESTNKLWAFDWPAKSDVVLATIEGDPQDQDWDDFAAAVISASQLCNADGPIIIWSNISTLPDRNHRKACMAQFEDGISSKLPKTLQHVAAILKDRPVFFKSKLTRSSVEELGLGFVESPQEVVRIAEPFSTGLVIRDAHKCQIQTIPNGKKNEATTGETQ